MTVNGYKVEVKVTYVGKTWPRKRNKYNISVSVYGVDGPHSRASGISLYPVIDMSPTGSKVRAEARRLAEDAIVKHTHGARFEL